MANIIQQFKNANGDNIFPLAYAQGGCKMDLLWTNPSPTSGFPEQTLSLDLEGYSLILIQTKQVAQRDYVSWNIAMVGEAGQIVAFYANDTPLFRDISVTSTGIVFSNGKSAVLQVAFDPSYAVPIKIYGIKMSYIVPTSVHGLQYVEV